MKKVIKAFVAATTLAITLASFTGCNPLDKLPEDVVALLPENVVNGVNDVYGKVDGVLGTVNGYVDKVTGFLPTPPVCEHAWADATCLLPKTCTLCGVIEDAPLGHTEEIIPIILSTCTETGLSEGVVCSVCDVVIVAQEATPSEHRWDNPGSKEMTCKLCGEYVNYYFAGGKGTAEDPYLIENAEQLMSISLNYDKGYMYYKVADGVEVIDCSIIPNRCISLNGSFDGNNARFVNLAYQLFNNVGYQNNVDDITIKNIDATFNSVEGGALVRSLINGGVTTFDNVQIHGYLEGSGNMGCFYKYGTAQYGNGASYTVNFVNSKADATVVDISGNVVGGLIGHTFHGTGNTVTINVDANSGFFGAQYSTTGKGYNLAAISNTCILNGEPFTNNVISVNKIDIVKAEKAEDGSWVVAKQNNVTGMAVTIFAQYTDYNADGTEKPNSSGLTAVVGSEMIVIISETTRVFGSVDSVEFVNEYLNGSMGYTLEGGVLKVYVGDRNVLSGNVHLQVAQYDAKGNVVATGSVKLGEVVKP